ncbi:hypothetical protein D3OALGB2SA_3211 [Olavius algarvensis associated proteobacterium Delta 3]|nr:hypothetical protein D3OALGB2SA_3211 [Olavius algarvensis associated proteobacterium Delta 3]
MSHDRFDWRRGFGYESCGTIGIGIGFGIGTDLTDKRLRGDTLIVK